MPGITGMLTTFNSPNYVGELFGITPTDTPLLSAIGGLTGGQSTDSVIFTWQTYDLRAPDTTRQRLEDADAPPPEHRVRTNAFNVVEIHQEALDISYTRQAATGQFAGTGSAVSTSAGVSGSNPVGDELFWQGQRSLEQIARDIEKTFIAGTFAQPTDNTAPRKTRGLLQAIATNVITNSSPTALTEEMILDLLQTRRCLRHARSRQAHAISTRRGRVDHVPRIEFVTGAIGVVRRVAGRRVPVPPRWSG